MEVNQIVETAVGGMNLTQTVEGRERYPIRIRYQRALRDRIEDLSRLPVVTESGEAVERQLRQAQADGTLKLPAGYSRHPVGSFENQIEANQRLMVIIPIVILLDLLIIYLNFRNLPLTLIIFAQIPISVFGGMIGLGIYGIEMNTAIWIGLIALTCDTRQPCRPGVRVVTPWRRPLSNPPPLRGRRECSTWAKWHCGRRPEHHRNH